MNMITGSIVAIVTPMHEDGSLDLEGMRRLVDLWSEIEITRVLGFGLRQVVGLPRIALGGGSVGHGLFDVRPMAELMQREISWRAVARSLRKRHLHALSVSTTEVSTGRTVVFMHTAPDVEIPPPPPEKLPTVGTFPQKSVIS